MTEESEEMQELRRELAIRRTQLKDAYGLAVEILEKTQLGVPRKLVKNLVNTLKLEDWQGEATNASR